VVVQLERGGSDNRIAGLELGNLRWGCGDAAHYALESTHVARQLSS